MGATASTVRCYNEVRSSQKRGETYIPIDNLNEHVRMFQHQTDGDVLMLVNDDADEFLKDSTAGQYQEIFISRRGTQYLDQLNLAMSFQASKALLDKAARAVAPVKVPKLDGDLVDGSQEVEKEPTLYQAYRKENPGPSILSGATAAIQAAQVASAKDPKKPIPLDGHKKTERDAIETPVRAASVGVGSLSTAAIAGDSGVLASGCHSMSVDLETDIVPPLFAIGSLNRSVDVNGETPSVSNVSSLSKSYSQDRESEVSRGTAQTIHSSSTAAANFLKHEQEQLAKLARGNSMAGISSEDRTAAPKSARGSGTPRQSKAAGDPAAALSPPQAMGTPSPRSSPRGEGNMRGIAALESGNASARSGAATSGSPAAGSSVAPVSGLTSRADSKDFKDGLASPASPPEPVPFRQFVPTAYLPPGQRHRLRIAAEEDDTRASIVDNSRFINMGFKEDSNFMSNVTMTYSTTGRSGAESKRLDGSFSVAENKHAEYEPVKLSPRAMSLLSTAAEGKPPSIRAIANLNASSSGSNATLMTGTHHGPSSGIASEYNNGTMGLGSSSTSTRSPGAYGGAAPNTAVCPNCGQELRSANARDSERFDSHVSTCSTRKEMRTILASIDLILEPKLEELAEFNRKQLNAALSTAIGKAADEFDQTTLAHAAVKRIVTSVLRVTYDTSAKKISRVEDALNSLVEKFSQEHIDALALSQQGNAEAQRRQGSLSNLLRILSQTADKLTLKRQNIAAYRKYLLGVQDLVMLRKLGKGSFASVYLARMVDTRQMYAVKVLSKRHISSADLYHQVMMERTAMVMASRYPDYFVTLQFAFQNRDELFFVMEYMQGGDCLSLLSSVKRLPEHVAQHFIAQISLAVKHLHTHGVIHRDIKPDNVMITSRGHAKLGDFGSVFPIHPEFRIAPQQAAPRRPGETSMHLLSATSRSDAHGSQSHQYATTPSSVNSRSVRGGQGAMVNQFAHEISAAAASAFRSLQPGKSKGSSGSNSLWLDEESDLPQNVSDGLQSSSNNWSSNSTSSLFFNKAAGGPMMQNTFDIVGNYFYASPEMAGGTCIFNQSVDWWAVGVMLFHMLTGTTPFEGLTKASTLENIERMHGDWDALPEEVTPGCRDFLIAILTRSYETRLGSASPDEIIGHPFFANIHFPTLYEGYGPYYPRPPSADESSPDFYCFSVITEEESLEVPRFSPSARDDKYTDCSQNDDFAMSRSGDQGCDSSASQSKGMPCEDDLYQDFDFHPFH